MIRVEIVKIWLPIESCVPASTSLNAVPAKGAGSAAATGMLRVAVLAAAATAVLLQLVLVPCDTSPGGLLTTMRPRSTYKTVTPGCGRPRACFVAENIRVRRAAAAAARGPARSRALIVLPRPSGDNPIGSRVRVGLGCKIGNWQLCAFHRPEKLSVGYPYRKTKKKKTHGPIFELVCRKNLARLSDIWRLYGTTQ